jgi:hypothetical protein
VRQANGEPWTWVTGELFDEALWPGKRVNEPDAFFMSWHRGDWDDIKIGLQGKYYLVEWGTLGPTVASMASSQQQASRSPLTIPAEALSFGGHRYLLVDCSGDEGKGMLWDEAKAKAEAMGGHLVAVTSQAEYDWVHDNVWSKRKVVGGVYERMFLGAIRPAGDTNWKWVTGEPLDLALWKVGYNSVLSEKDRVLIWVKDDKPARWAAGDRTSFYGGYFVVEWDSLGPALAVTSSSTVAQPPAASNALDRQVAQRLLDLKFPVKLKIAGKVSSLKPGASLPSEPFVLFGIDTGAKASVPRAELAKLLSDFRQLASVVNSFLPTQDCDLWAEVFGAMPSIIAVNAASCEELTDVGAGHLARLPKLEYVNIGSSLKITGVGISAFEACKSLTTIELNPQAITDGKYTLADLQKLQDALPKTRVVFDGVKPIPGLKPATTQSTPTK